MLDTLILYLLGLDYERLTFHHNGVNRHRTDVQGHVVWDILVT